MILIREVQEQDLPALEEFSKIPGFISLTGDTEELRKKIARSQLAFQGKIKAKPEAKFIFIAEDLSTKKVVGTSMLTGQHGTPESPHYYFQVGTEEKYSDTINTGFIHGTLELKIDGNGPTEIGGLVISPEYRNTEDRVGRQISFVRFLYVGLNKNKFKSEIIAELLPPLNKRGQSPLWEAVGRRFTNMDYWEADALSQKNKEFILSLFPQGKIYTTFLSAEARNAIGKVGDATLPVFHMLKKIGFEYRHQVDPFDGGPHLWAKVDDLLPVKNVRKMVLAQDSLESEVNESQIRVGLISGSNGDLGKFRALSAQVVLSAENQISLVASGRMPGSKEVAEFLSVKLGEPIFFMPYY